MPEYNGNDIYLTVDGVNVEARWRDFQPSKKIADVDISAGATETHEKHAKGLEVISAKMVLMYDSTAAASDMAAQCPADALVTVAYGPENNTAGKPRHEQIFKINSITGPSPNYKKDAVMLEFDMIGADEPTHDMYRGATW